jgi:glycosyltransferase involved in cell wall biosynthesis
MAKKNFMKIGFDAKRAFNNNTGLGHYSRTLITNLAHFFPTNKYFLFAPFTSNMFDISSYKNVEIKTPESFLNKIQKKTWRSKWVVKDLQKNGVDIYHGLSHQIPIGINDTNIKSVVTIHDLIFERYPEQHGKINVLLYRKKFKHACKYADAVIAISEQTKKDLVDFYKIPEEKITVCYQTCDPSFVEKVNDDEKLRIKTTYNLPDKFFLSVGSITERKNLLTICKAMKNMDSNIPLVVIGNGRQYKKEIKKYLQENKMEHKVIFLNEMEIAQTDSFKNSTDFPAIYQCATAFVYTSIFEGFGIPILEAMCSGIPVICSNTSCMPETGGDAAMYVNPYDDKDLAIKMNMILNDENTAIEMIKKGFLHAHNFSAEKCTQSVMEVYKKVYQDEF